MICSNLERIKEGIGDKFGMLLQYTAQFIAGFIIAFFYSWQLTLVMLSLTPLLAACGAFMSKVRACVCNRISNIHLQLVSSATQRESLKYAIAGAIAEEVLSSMRTVIAFNAQKQESER